MSMTTVRWLAFILAALILVPAALFGATPSSPRPRGAIRIPVQHSVASLATRARYEILLRSAPAGDARAIRALLAGR